MIARRGAERSRKQTLAWTLLALAGTLALALAVAVLDHAIAGGLPAPLVTLALPAGATLVAAALIARVALRQAWNPLFLAREFERLHEVRHNPVLNAAALAAEEHYPAALIDAAAERARRTIAETPPRRSVSRPLRTSAWLVAAVLLAWLLFASLTPKPILVSLGRMVGLPWPAPTATQIGLLRPAEDEGVYRGEPLTLEFRVTGRTPPAVAVEIAPPGADPAGPPLRRMAEAIADPPGRWRALLAPHEVTDDFAFRCMAGDAQLSGVIHTRPQPRELELAVHVEPPPHAGPPYDADPQQPLVVWSESKATFRFRSNTRVREPILVLRGADTTRTRMAVSPDDPAVAGVTLPIRAGGEFWVEFTDAWGHAAGDPIRRTLVVRHDQPPTIEIAEPAAENPSDAEHALARTPWLEVAASDDLSLTDLSLVAETAEGLRRIPLLDSPRDAGPRARERISTARIAPPPGESVRLWFEASDNHVDASGRPAPQTARSDALVLTNRANAAGGLDQTAIVDEYATDREQGSGASAAGDAGGGPHGSDASGTGGDANEATGGKNETGRDGRDTGQDVSETDGDASASDGDEDAGDHNPDENDDGTHAGDQAPDPNRPGDGSVDGGQDASDADAGETGGNESASATESGDDSASRGREPSHQGAGDAAPDASGEGRQDAEQAFDDELRRFAREFGREAREVADAKPNRDPSHPSRDPSHPSRDPSHPSRDREGAGTDSSSANATGDPHPRGDDGAEGGADPNRNGNNADDDPQAPGQRGAEIGKQDPPSGRSTDGAPDGGNGEGSDAYDAALKLLEREEPLTDADLSELGWSDERRDQFAAALRRLREAALRAGFAPGVRSWTWSRAADGETPAGAVLSPDIAVAGGGEELIESVLRTIVPPPEQRISPALRAVLDAYYRAMAARAVPASQPSPP